MAPTFDILRERAAARMAALRIPGVAIAVLHQGQVEAAGFGVTSVDNPLPVTADTLFQIGSITKTFIGTTAMRLAEQGVLSLDSPVKAYLPDLKLRDPAAEAKVTMRHLLSHTGGWAGDYFNDFGWGDDAIVRMVAACADLPQLTPVGSTWHYNNAGFAIAGRVIEVVSGQAIEEAVRERVFAPLGLRDSAFWPHEAMVKRFSVGHLVGYGDADAPKVATPWPIGRASASAGGIASTVNDLLRYARMHLLQLAEGQAPALSTDSVRAMREPVAVAGGTADAWGLSWAIRAISGRTVLGHGGATNGFIADLSIVPDTGFAIATLTNANRGRELIAELVPLALKAYCGLDKPSTPKIDLAPDRLAAYAGVYTSQLTELTLKAEGARVRVVARPLGRFPFPDSPPPPAPPPSWLAFIDADRAEIMDGPSQGSLVEFLRNPDGSIAWLRTGGRLHEPVGRR